MTTVAALQCVDRGLVTLDEDITRILPEFQRARMLMGFDERTGAPILVNSFVTLTLRLVSLDHSRIGA
jgi:CubicO group peptidase (beta-lactamase class C family)